MNHLASALAMSVALVSVAAIASQPEAQPRVSSKPQFILYASPGSSKLLADDPVDLKWRVNRWRDLLRERGASYTIVTHPQQLAQVPLGAALILPSAVVLNDDERRQITQRIASGESLLATWMPGTLDAQGKAVATGFLENAFHVSAKSAPVDDKSFLVTVADTPLTHALPTGSRLWLGQDKRYPTPLLTTTGGAYLANWSRAPGETGLLAFTTVGNSRRALLGWPEAAWGGQAEFLKLAQLALDWAEGKPVAYLRNWPSPYRGAMTIGVDALWRFENVPRIAELMSRFGVRGSFHFLPADAASNAALIRELLKGGHSVGGFGDVAEPFAGQPEGEQRARVERMMQGFRSTLGADFALSGLRAPQGATDTATERAAASLDYLVDSGRIDSTVPVLAENRRLALISASANFGTESALETIASGLAEAAGKARLLGGYAFVGVDGAGFLRASALEVGLNRFLEGTRESGKDLWKAHAAEVAAWWRERGQLRVSSTWDARESLMIVDVAVGERMRFAAAIALVPPPGRKTVRIEEALSGVQLQPEADGSFALVLTGLPAGEHRLRLRFLP